MDFNSKIPLYAQVKSHILKKIETGEWTPGYTLPTEQELQNQLEVSRITVRHAIDELVNEGYVNKKQGKGTYVSPPKLSYPLPKLTSFSQDMKHKGFTPSSKILVIQISSYPNVAQRLKLPDTTLFLYIRRLRRIDGINMGIHDEFINLSLLDSEKILSEVSGGKLVEKLDLKSISLYDILEKEYNIEICYADESIEAIPCSREFAPLLDIKLSDPLLLLVRATYSSDDKPLEYCKMYNRADMYKYSVRLTR